MSAQSETAVVGCLFDVSRPMREAFEASSCEESVSKRLDIILDAALKLARTEYQNNAQALIFVGVFGLKFQDTSPQVVDLCSVLEALFEDGEESKTGHKLLIDLLNVNNLTLISKYIGQGLTDLEVRVIYVHLKRHLNLLTEFTNGVDQAAAYNAPEKAEALANANHRVGYPFLGPLSRFFTFIREHGIPKEWLLDSASLNPRPVSNVLNVLQRLQVYRKEMKAIIFKYAMRQCMYGDTPMNDALERSLEVFQKHPDAGQRVLILVSNGNPTDGDPLPIARRLWENDVKLASVYLTSDKRVPRRHLYDREDSSWSQGQRTLFRLASKVPLAMHPVSMLSSNGWQIPSSGECALYATVCSTDLMDKLHSLLLSASPRPAKSSRFCRKPMDQGCNKTCYAHATAAGVHLAFARHSGRRASFPSAKEILEKVLEEFPPDVGQTIENVLKKISEWYHPFQARQVDVEKARQAVLQRRPVIATFCLSRSGWRTFRNFFKDPKTRDKVLTSAHMAPHRKTDATSWHVVVMTDCGRQSMTFLNSWGKNWGDNGSFSIEDHTVLGVDSRPEMRYYEIFWLEGALSEDQRQVYYARTEKLLRSHAARHPSILELEVQCPLCQHISRIADFTGTVRQIACPHCQGSFAPELYYFLKALYSRAGIDGADYAADVTAKEPLSSVSKDRRLPFGLKG
ncbi:hypothetical protein BDV25DRAFT_146415 [Aspergillus avenaceus]|uniref:Peptidase C1A papain C-terminal domain-containing protein n=1 Tax=Aspergillus avenaceus TaxID=36643 RepID=A0A5N6U9I1_ASPAV|nr:hypothetical protein BDV25DRAFT_146415 [Aspergillus avenaceus]